MPERHFIPATMLEGYALYQIPHGRTFVVECQSCRAMKEIDRSAFDGLPQMASLKELSPRFRCTLWRGEERTHHGWGMERGTMSLNSRTTHYATLALLVIVAGVTAFQIVRPLLVWVGLL